MTDITQKIKNTWAQKRGIFAARFLLLSLIAYTWILTCGLVKLVTLCLKLHFTWITATEIWLVFWILGIYVHSRCKNRKGTE